MSLTTVPVNPRRQRGRVGCWVCTTAIGIALAIPAWASDPVPSVAVRQNLFSTCFVDERTGWAVGDLGRIFRTDDGTATWKIQQAGTKRPFVSIACHGQQHAWIVGQAGQAARTVDAGTTWEPIASGTDRKLLSVAFVDERTGLIVGDQGTIRTTTDGGNSWSVVEVPPETELPEEYFGIVEPSDIVLYAGAWASRNKAVIVGEFGVILISSDGGRSFEPRRSGVQSTLFGVFFADEQRGWAVGMDSVLLHTTDGGETWRRLTIQSPPGFSLSLYDVEVRGDRGWAVGNSGFLLRSSDAGASWQLVDVPPQMGSYWLREVSLLPNGNGFAVGSSGLVLVLEGTAYRPNKSEL